MNRKTIIFTTVILALLATAGLTRHSQKVALERERVKEETAQEAQRAAEAKQAATTQSERDSIKDLIDGEYTFTLVDTSDWKIYRNETAGFEVKIPNDWFCSGIALAPKSNENLICLEEKLRNEYYAGEFQNVEEYIMVNFTGSENGTLRNMRDRLATKKEEGSKIVGLAISGKDSVLVDGSYLFDIFGKWNFIISASVKKGVADGFLKTFRFLK